MIMTGENRITGRETFHNVAWSYTNPTCTALVTNPMLGERPANNHLFLYYLFSFNKYPDNKVHELTAVTCYGSTGQKP